MRTKLMNQNQLEALVDLLVLATTIDLSFSSIETETLEKNLSTAPWKSLISLSSYVNASFARVRALVKFAEKEKYLHELCLRFDQDQMRRDAFMEIETVLKSDGLVVRESVFLEMVRHEFYLVV
jgi:hypothetical protein